MSISPAFSQSEIGFAGSPEMLSPVQSFDEAVGPSSRKLLQARATAEVAARTEATL